MPYEKITTIKELEFAAACMLHTLNVEGEFLFAPRINAALKTAEKMGLPNSDEYSHTHIFAENRDDLNLKIQLLLLPYAVMYLEDEIDNDKILNQTMPITFAVETQIAAASAKVGIFNIVDEYPHMDYLDYPITIRSAFPNNINI